jgi:hypothetical protein
MELEQYLALCDTQLVKNKFCMAILLNYVGISFLVNPGSELLQILKQGASIEIAHRCSSMYFFVQLEHWSQFHKFYMYSSQSGQ